MDNNNLERKYKGTRVEFTGPSREKPANIWATPVDAIGTRKAARGQFNCTLDLLRLCQGSGRLELISGGGVRQIVQIRNGRIVSDETFEVDPPIEHTYNKELLIVL